MPAKVKPANNTSAAGARAKPLPRFPVPRHAPPALSPGLAAAGVRLRAATMDDLPFLRQLNRAILAPAFALAPWSAAERDAVMTEQFDLQHRHYLQHFPRADYWIIERAGNAGAKPIGRYYLNRHGTLWRALDLGFLPGKRGFGAALLNWTKTLAAAAGADGFDFHVAHDNSRAHALYLKLGFEDVDAPLATHQRMIWRNPKAGSRGPSSR
ncbi:GNAT family N-acetyltransferase [Sphingomonas sp. GlSt437]|uniref:GNAT family N-acetyltransferase n=1 Tax=Sphingomonas sp. GlSt437 TaxID=3389970 RepID=UPI003A86EE1B